MTPDVSLAQVIREALSPYGVIVFHQSTPELAVVHAISRPVDLIILDERIGDLRGKSILVYIRSAAPKSALMIIGEYGHGSCTIDASARGADVVISRRSSKEQILNAACHALGVPYERRPGVGPFYLGGGRALRGL